MPDVRVATLNLFNNAAGRWPDRADLVVEQAKALDADVFALLDVGRAQIARTLREQQGLLAELASE